MHEVWVILGMVVLGLAFLDVFLTVLNYDESGFLATRLCELLWRGVRMVTRRLSRRWRPVALRQVTGLQAMLCVATWLGCIALGFGFIYYGLMEGTNFQYAGPDMGANMFSAMYLSAAQLSTVGTSQINPQTDLLRVLTIAETLSAPVLITLILTFLLGVYQVIRDLRTLSSNFSSAELGAGDPVASLAAYFPNGQPTGLEGQLQSIHDSFWTYADGLRQHHIGYYFQSGRDQFSLPYTLHMTGGTLAALRWGLPTGHPASMQPELARLITQFGQFADYLHDELGWTSIAVPEVVSFDDFSAAHCGSTETPDSWLGRFFRLTQQMAQLARLESAENPQQAYARYQQWLPFAYRAEQVAAAVSRDLDYQPLVRGVDPSRANAGRGNDSLFAVQTWARSWRVLLKRWVAVPDPGLTRLAAAAGAMLATAAAVLTLYALFSIIGMPVMPAAMFGGIVGMYAATMPNDAMAADRKLTTALMVLPAIVAAVLGAAFAPWYMVSGTALVLMALLGVWVGGFGTRLAALGSMAFMAYYFALLLHPGPTQLPAFAIAALIGASWAYLFHFVFMAERPERVLLGGLDAYRARLVLMFDALIDAVSAARWDPDVRKRVRADQRQLQRCAAFLQGQLRVIDPALVNLHAHAGALRLLVFDTELAATNVMTAAQDVARAGSAVPVALRGQLAGMLDRVQEQLRREGSKDPADAARSAQSSSHRHPEDDPAPPESWPRNACRLHGAVRELLRATRTLREARAAITSQPSPGSLETMPDTVSTVPDASVDSGPPQSAGAASIHGLMSPTGRRAIQAAAATGLALLAGTAVTSGHQYWAALAAFSVLGGTATVEETMVKGLERVVGTIIGAIIGFAVTNWTGADPFVVLPLLAFCVFGTMYFQPVSSGLQVFWMTMALSLMYEFLGTLSKETLQVRVLETVIGAAIAFAASVLLLPIRSRQKINADVVALLHTLDDITADCLKRLGGHADIALLDNQALALDRQLWELNSRVEPLRRAPGAMGLDGIERRLTTISALIYYARHLIKATEAIAPGDAPLAAATGVQLGAITHDNLAAFLQVLNKELPGPVHGSDELPLQPDTPESLTTGSNAGCRAAMYYLVRINQTVLAYIEELTRDSTSSVPTA